MNTAETEKRQSTFAVGEVIMPDAGVLKAQFRVKSVGRSGMVITRISPKPIVPKEPFLVTFKNVKFKVVGWDKQRDFTLHTTNE